MYFPDRGVYTPYSPCMSTPLVMTSDDLSSVCFCLAAHLQSVESVYQMKFAAYRAYVYCRYCVVVLKTLSFGYDFSQCQELLLIKILFYQHKTVLSCVSQSVIRRCTKCAQTRLAAILLMSTYGKLKSKADLCGTIKY